MRDEHSPNQPALKGGLAKRRRSREFGTRPGVDLSFMAPLVPEGSGIDYWCVEGTGSYSSDCTLGEKLAEEYLAYIGLFPTNGNASLLGPIVGSMVKRCGPHGKVTGIEIAFLARVNEYAMTMAKFIAQPAVTA